MYVRLAFAVAAHLEPEILVVDEVLAVGDAEFQKKCLGKMAEVAGGGRTVLLVSHNLVPLRVLCSRGILLSEGRLASAGSIASVLSTYSGVSDLSRRNYPPDTPVRYVAVSQETDGIVLELEYAGLRGKLSYPGFAFVIHDCDGRPILGHHPMMDNQNLGFSWPDPGIVRVKITSPKLLDGIYTISAYMGDFYATIFTDLHCLTFSVSGAAQANYQLPVEHIGSVYPICRYDFVPIKTRDTAARVDVVGSINSKPDCPIAPQTDAISI